MSDENWQTRNDTGMDDGMAEASLDEFLRFDATTTAVTTPVSRSEKKRGVPSWLSAPVLVVAFAGGCLLADHFIPVAVIPSPPLPRRVASTLPVPAMPAVAATQEPVAQEPVAQEPVAQEPVAQEPVAQEPVAQEPVAQEPVAQEPVAQAARYTLQVGAYLRPVHLRQAEAEVEAVGLAWRQLQRRVELDMVRIRVASTEPLSLWRADFPEAKVEHRGGERVICLGTFLPGEVPRLKELYPHPRLERVHLSRTLTVLRAGRFSNRRQAEMAAARLRRQGVKPLIVQHRAEEG